MSTKAGQVQSQELLVPFRPPLVYGAEGRLCFPWFSFWRSNPIVNKRLSLFVSVVDEILSSDPDLEEEQFQILDFSAPKPSASRVLSVIDAKEVPLISEEDKKAMLAAFAEGFSLAQEELARTEDYKRPDAHAETSDQLGLFDS